MNCFPYIIRNIPIDTAMSGMTPTPSRMIAPISKPISSGLPSCKITTTPLATRTNCGQHC
jgi:hypothetical protein